MDEFRELRDELRSYRIGNTINGKGKQSNVLNGNIPSDFALYQNHPNPFNPDTEIRYDLRETSNVRLEIFNISGQKVCTLVDGMETMGYKTATWNGRSSDGKSAASGIYIYRLTAEGHQSGEKFVQSMKMTLLQ